MADPLETVEGLFESWARGDFAAGAESLSPEVRFVVGSSLAAPTDVRGPAAVEAYMRSFLSHWEDYSIEATRLSQVGESVVAEILQRGKGRTSGIASEQVSFMVFTFDGSELIRIDSVLGEEEALALAREASGD
jgi:ketosteroid isomerase-like protein